MGGHDAYAVGHLDTTQTPPKFLGVAIYSEDAGSVTVDQRKAFPFDIASGYSPDGYAEARASLLDHLQKFYPWAHAALLERER